MKRYVLDLLEDGHSVSLAFGDYESAYQFTVLVMTYVDSTGSGNGYGAYWLADKTCPQEVEGIPSHTKTKIRYDLVWTMIQNIVSARLLGEDAFIFPGTTIRHDRSDGAIDFRFNARMLPDILSPEVGDMCRVIRSCATFGEEVVGLDGRVLDILPGKSSDKDIFLVESIIAPDQGHAKVPRYALMKIRDYTMDSNRLELPVIVVDT